MLDEEAISLFRAEMRGVKPLKQDTFVAARSHKKKTQSTIKEQREQQDTLFYFSDEYEPLLNEESAVKYLRENEDSHLLKQLRRGDFSPEIFLDLHGLTRWLVQHPKVRALHQAPKEWGGEAAILILIDV